MVNYVKVIALLLPSVFMNQVCRMIMPFHVHYSYSFTLFFVYIFSIHLHYSYSFTLFLVIYIMPIRLHYSYSFALFLFIYNIEFDHNTSRRNTRIAFLTYIYYLRLPDFQVEKAAMTLRLTVSVFSKLLYYFTFML